MKRYFGIMIMVCLCSLVFVGSSGAAPVLHNGHYYDLTTVSGGWEACEAEAVSNGSHLVTINDAAEEAWLISQFGTSRYWIGFTDKAAEGTWVWVSGEAVTYTNWAGGEPNNSTPPTWGEDYAVMNWSGSSWNDFDEKRPDFPAGGYKGITESPVPLPASLLLFAPGMVGLLAIRRRFKK